MRKVLITGATGFIGSHLVEQNIKENNKIKVLLRSGNPKVGYFERHGIEVIYGDRFDLLVFLQCTHPIRRKGDIDAAIVLAERYDASIYSATATDQYVIYDGYGNFYWDHKRARRQDRRPALLESGNLYVISPKMLRKYNNRMHYQSVEYIMPWWCGLEIDEEEDIETCELIMQWKQSELAWMPETRS